MDRGITQGKNVLDMLLNRMKQYANNLEGLVEERTVNLHNCNFITINFIFPTHSPLYFIPIAGKLITW